MRHFLRTTGSACRRVRVAQRGHPDTPRAFGLKVLGLFWVGAASVFSRPRSQRCACDRGYVLPLPPRFLIFLHATGARARRLADFLGPSQLRNRSERFGGFFQMISPRFLIFLHATGARARRLADFLGPVPITKPIGTIRWIVPNDFTALTA